MYKDVAVGGQEGEYKAIIIIIMHARLGDMDPFSLLLV